MIQLSVLPQNPENDQKNLRRIDPRGKEWVLIIAYMIKRYFHPYHPIKVINEIENRMRIHLKVGGDVLVGILKSYQMMTKILMTTI
mmetsp:Transcript_2727/g.3382  ORF Transcript_2727/g.3382 Transcript_2727/m.3382 type:complete len:86 (-) Transcript_2727:309-566(-)